MVLAEEVANTMDFFMGQKRCTIDPATLSVIERYLDLDGASPTDPIHIEIVLQFELLARLKRRQLIPYI